MLTLIFSFFIAAICLLSPKIPIGAVLSIIILFMTRELADDNLEGALARRIAKITLVLSLCLCAVFMAKGYYEQQKAEKEAIDEQKKAEEAAAALEIALAEEAKAREAEEAKKEKEHQENITAIDNTKQSVIVSQETDDELDSLGKALDNELSEDEEYRELKEEISGKESSVKTKGDAQTVTITESEESEKSVKEKAEEEAKKDTSLYLYTINYGTTLSDDCPVTVVGTIQYYSGDNSIIQISHTVIDEILSQYTVKDLDNGNVLKALQKKFKSRIAEEVEIKSAEIIEVSGITG